MDGSIVLLLKLLSQCKDFSDQKTDLEQLCDEISAEIPNFVSVLFTPKFHCELAGEGIEYSWGASKRYYRRQPITMKRSTLNFERLVKDSINKVSTMMCRRFFYIFMVCMLFALPDFYAYTVILICFASVR